MPGGTLASRMYVTRCMDYMTCWNATIMLCTEAAASTKWCPTTHVSSLQPPGNSKGSQSSLWHSTACMLGNALVGHQGPQGLLARRLTSSAKAEDNHRPACAPAASAVLETRSLAHVALWRRQRSPSKTYVPQPVSRLRLKADTRTRPTALVVPARLH